MPDIKKEKEPQFSWKEYFKASFLNALQKEGILEKERERIFRETEAARAAVKEKTRDLIEELKKAPPMPSRENLPPYPNIPEKIETFKNLGSHVKLLFSIGMLAATIRGVKIGIPELGLVTFSSAINALKKMDEDEFRRRMDEYILSLQRIKLETERAIWDYEQKLKQWELTKMKPLEMELIEQRQDYELSKSMLSMIDKSISDAQRLRNDIMKNWFQAEKEERKYMLDAYKAALSERKIRLEEQVKRAITPIERRKKALEVKKLEKMIEMLDDPSIPIEEKIKMLGGREVIITDPGQAEKLKEFLREKEK